MVPIQVITLYFKNPLWWSQQPPPPHPPPPVEDINKYYTLHPTENFNLVNLDDNKL